MNKIKKTLIIGGSTVLGLSVFVVAPATAFFLTGQPIPIYDQAKYLIRERNPLIIDGYFFDTTASYGTTASKSITSILTASFLKVDTTGETEFEKNANGDLVVSKPSVEKYVFALAKEIILEYKDPTTGLITTRVFDNDKAEIIPPNPSKLPTVTLRSNDVNSINSDEFENALKKPNLISLSFSVDENKKWVNSSLQETQYNIDVNDFYYSYMRTKLFDTKYRQANGGDKKLDTYFQKLTSAVNRFAEKDRYPNEYLFDVFNIDSKALVDQNKTIRTIKVDQTEKKVFSFHAIEGATSSWIDLIAKTVVNSNLFSAAPSQFIEQKLASNNALNTIKIGNETLEIKGEARKFGMYTYGARREDILYASAYVPTAASENRITFTKNKYYSNDEYVNNKETLKEIIIEYSNVTDDVTFQNQAFSSFQNKVLSEIDYSSLLPQQKEQIWGPDGNQYKQNGLLFTKKLNQTKSVGRTLLVSNISPIIDADPVKQKQQRDAVRNANWLNDEYAKIFYGYDLETLWDGKVSTTETYFSGTGLKLREYLLSAINWITYINNASSGTKVFWGNHAAENASFFPTSDNPEIRKTPLDFYNEVNSVGYWDTATNGFQYVTPKEMYDHFINNNSNFEQYKSPAFDKVKVLVKELLDKEGVTTTKPIRWKIIYPYVATTETIETRQLDELIKIIKALDPRLQPEKFLPNDRNQMINAITTADSTQKFWGWGYDYAGIGSFLDGISHPDASNFLGLIGLLSNPDANLNQFQKDLKKQLPRLTYLAESLNTYAKREWSSIYKSTDPKADTIKIENWHKLTNLDLAHVNENFKDYVPAFDLDIEMSKFFIYFQSNIVEGLDKETKAPDKLETFYPELLREMNIAVGFSMDSTNSIDNPNSNGLLLVQHAYEYPTANVVQYIQDVRIPKKN
ncbi:MAG: OppA family ABC transporter substrate-binding lipoprotein [Metamycoplasmataceae bacterium]